MRNSKGIISLSTFLKLAILFYQTVICEILFNKLFHSMKREGDVHILWHKKNHKKCLQMNNILPQRNAHPFLHYSFMKIGMVEEQREAILRSFVF